MDCLPARFSCGANPRVGGDGGLAGAPLPGGDFGGTAAGPGSPGIGSQISSLHVERGSGRRRSGGGSQAGGRTSVFGGRIAVSQPAVSPDQKVRGSRRVYFPVSRVFAL